MKSTYIEYNAATGEFDEKEIPDASYYVVSEDTFFGDWGPAKDKRNICIVPCADHTMSCIVGNYVMSRTDQKNVNITKLKPKNRPGIVYSLLEQWGKRAMEEAFKTQ